MTELSNSDSADVPESDGNFSEWIVNQESSEDQYARPVSQKA
jgi:hypothetical protein